jgi:hypothetical protein
MRVTVGVSSTKLEIQRLKSVNFATSDGSRQLGAQQREMKNEPKPFGEARAQSREGMAGVSATNVDF